MIAAIYARSLIAALGLLALATSASAECAWVLWIQVGTPQGPTAVQFAGYARWEDCEKERVAKQPPPGGAPAYFICLPDTMVPLGALGGKR
jgi:hypothetical protein